MKKFLSVLILAIIFSAQINFAYAAKLTLYDGSIEELCGLMNNLVTYDYNGRLKFGAYYDFTNTKNHTYFIIHYGETKETAAKDGDDYFGFRLNDNRTVAYAYLTVDNIADSPDKERRLNNAHFAFNLLCEAMRMSNEDRDGLWNQTAAYGAMTNYSFSAGTKNFYQRCTSIHRDIKFTFKPINDNKGIRLILSVVQP